MYCYQEKIRYSEIDDKGNLSIGGLLNFFQDGSIFQSEELGVGVEYLREKKQAWVLASWQIEIVRMPKLCEMVTIGTFPYDFKKALGFRNFFLKDEKGEMLAKANTLWMLISTETGQPQIPEQKMLDAYGMEPALEMEPLKRRIDILPDGTEEEPFIIRKYHLDTNNHVNNGQYVCMASEYLPEDFEVKGIRAEYKKSALYGDVLYSYVVKNEDVCQISFRDNEQKVYVNVEFVK